MVIEAGDHCSTCHVTPTTPIPCSWCAMGQGQNDSFGIWLTKEKRALAHESLIIYYLIFDVNILVQKYAVTKTNYPI